MFNFVRAVGYAAVVLGALVAPTLADPSLAYEVDPASDQISYIEHASAGLDPVTPGGESTTLPKTLAHDIDFTTQVATHAVATPEESAEAAQPSGPGKSLASLVDAHAAVDLADSEMECLAGAIYFESKGEPLAGQLAVAEVIINRAKSGKYPGTLCGVIKQPSQFSFIRGGRFPRIDKDSAAWRKAVAIAHIAKNDLADSPVPSAMSFHATYVSPRWRMKRLATVGRHIFYR